VRALTSFTAAAGVLMLSAVPAAAHLGHVVVRAERYIKIEAAPGEARVVVSMSLGANQMYAVMAAADGDGNRDGKVSPEEAEAYLARWGQGLEEELPIELDGKPAKVRWGEGYLTPLGPLQVGAGVVEMVARIPLDGGRHTIVVRDRMRPEVADRTDVAFRARDGAELVATGMGETDRVIADMAYGPQLVAAGKADAITAVVDVPGLSQAGRWGLFVALGLLVAVALVSWVALRRRARA
jgi:hypothetical protein